LDHDRLKPTERKKSDPTPSTAAKCFSSFATSPGAAKPTHEAEQETKDGYISITVNRNIKVRQTTM